MAKACYCADVAVTRKPDIVEGQQASC